MSYNLDFSNIIHEVNGSMKVTTAGFLSHDFHLSKPYKMYQLLMGFWFETVGKHNAAMQWVLYAPPVPLQTIAYNWSKRCWQAGFHKNRKLCSASSLSMHFSLLKGHCKICKVSSLQSRPLEKVRGLGGRWNSVRLQEIYLLVRGEGRHYFKDRSISQIWGFRSLIINKKRSVMLNQRGRIGFYHTKG